ncbi:MAG: hypothetical protein ACI4UY_03490 [Kiritimatiellia bacterium]
MKRCVLFLLLSPICFSTSTWGRVAVPAALPPVTHADTEVMTNVPFTVALDVSGRFAFDLSCRATPSNNVEVAFGTDANGNGVLEPEETDRVVGWDCGSWFTRKGADGACQMENGEWKIENGVEPEVRTLSWRVLVGADGTPFRLEATADGSPAFADLPPGSVYRASWNLLRLTGRGLDASLETFSVSATPDGTVFIMR